MSDYSHYHNRVIVAGSRDFDDYELVRKTLDEFLVDMLPSNTCIVSGMARGADMLGERYAKERGYKVAPFPAKWRDEKGNYDPGAGYARNAQMAEIATHLVAFWDFASSGTRNMIAIANERGVTIKVVKCVHRETMTAETQVFKTSERVLGPIYAQITPETYRNSNVITLLVEARGHDGIRHSERQVLDEDWLYSNFDLIWERMGVLLKKHMRQYYAQLALDAEQTVSFE